MGSFYNSCLFVQFIIFLYPHVISRALPCAEEPPLHRSNSTNDSGLKTLSIRFSKSKNIDSFSRRGSCQLECPSPAFDSEGRETSPAPGLYTSYQRVLNYVQRTRLSGGRLIWLLPHPFPLSRQQIVSLSQSSCVSRRRACYRRGGKVGDEEGAKSYGGEAAWSSINHSIISVLYNI